MFGLSAKILIILTFSMFSQLGYSLLAPLFPPLATSLKVSDTIIGLIFSSYAFSNFLFILLTPKLIQIFSKKNILLISTLVEASCTIWFGLTSLISNKIIFIIASLSLRLLQGCAGALMQTCMYSITAGFSSKEDVERNIGYIEVGEAIGVSTGPLVASICYHLFGYKFPFIFAGFLECCLLILVPKLEIEKYEMESDNDSECSEDDVKSEKKGFGQILLNRNFLLLFIASFFDASADSFIYPVFSSHLSENFHLRTEIISFFFSIVTIFYFIALQFLPFFLRFLKHKTLITIGLFFNSLFILFLGPEIFLPKNYIIIIIGLSCMGFSGCCISVPAVIEMIKTLQYEEKFNKSMADDYSSALYNFAYNCGGCFGPLMGGYMTDKFGFVKANRYNSMANFFFFAIYVAFYLSDRIRKKEYVEVNDSNLLTNDTEKVGLIGFNKEDNDDDV